MLPSHQFNVSLCFWERGVWHGGTLPDVTRPLLSDPPQGGGGHSGPWPTHPPDHIRKLFLRQKMKVIKGAGNLRPISDAQTSFWPLASCPLSNGLDVTNASAIHLRIRKTSWHPADPHPPPPAAKQTSHLDPHLQIGAGAVRKAVGEDWQNGSERLLSVIHAAGGALGKGGEG